VDDALLVARPSRGSQFYPSCHAGRHLPSRPARRFHQSRRI